MSVKTPNILLFVCDDFRWDVIAALGHPQIKTPHLDRFLESGTAFTRCMMPGALCGAVCMPSRAMIHTGRGLFELQGNGEDVPSDQTLLGEWLQGAGYSAFHTGKWHNQRRSFARSFNAGGAIFFGGMGDQWNMPVYDFDSSGRYAGKIPYVHDPFTECELRHLDGDHTTDGRHATEVFVGEAIEFLRNPESGERPFFLSVALTAPHDPRNAPPAFHALYEADAIDLPPNFLSQHPHHTGALGGRDENLAALPRNPDEIRQHIADYYAMISHLDAEFGRLLETLESTGKREETIVVFTADHGLAVGQHGLMGKQCVYEHSLRIPMILAGPGIPAGNRCDALVRHHDLFATLADLTGIPAPRSVTGRSMQPFLGGAGSGNGHHELYLSYGDSVRGLLLERWKLIEYRRPGYAATQLFSLETDPEECFDRSQDPSCRERVEAMRRRLAELSETNGDRGFPEGVRYWGNW